MPLQNRVTAMGDIVAAPERGTFTGNRGIIHDPSNRTLLNRRWASPAWLVCVLEWRGRRRDVMGTRSWTELFFLDEATAFAAGHRPCFYCRREAALAFQARFPGGPKAPEMDRVLHAERLDGRRKRLHTMPADLPDGAMILQDGTPHLVLGGRALRWSLGGYGAPAALAKDARLVTPPSTLTVLKGGYQPSLHVSANPWKTVEIH
jgi:hypothetical protein